jgi:hypothetical protein
MAKITLKQDIRLFNAYRGRTRLGGVTQYRRGGTWSAYSEDSTGNHYGLGEAKTRAAAVKLVIEWHDLFKKWKQK